MLASFLLVLVCAQLCHGLSCHGGGTNVLNCAGDQDLCYIDIFVEKFDKKCVNGDVCPKKNGCGMHSELNYTICCCSSDMCNTELYLAKDGYINTDAEPLTCLADGDKEQTCLPGTTHCHISKYVGTTYTKRCATECPIEDGCGEAFTRGEKTCCCSGDKCNTEELFEKGENEDPLTCLNSHYLAPDRDDELCKYDNNLRRKHTHCQITYWLGKYQQKCVNGESKLECPEKDGCGLGKYPERKICCCKTPNCNNQTFFDKHEVAKPTEAPSGSWMLAGSGWVLMTSLVLGRM